MTEGNYDRARGRALLTMMERIRAFEQQAELAALRDKLVLGAIHLSIGQEAVAAGVMVHLTAADYLLSTHRGHGHCLAKGAAPDRMMKELLGRHGGNCGGKGGSMHIADFDVGMLGANGVVGANITIAAGAAHGIKLLGGEQIVVCFFGDGAANRGPFLEGLNWAGVFDLPILFVCEDNRYSATTFTQAMTSGRGAAERARSLGLATVEVDGNDADAVADSAGDIVARIRTTRAPAFLLARTYRQRGHTHADPAGYRPAGEADEMAAGNDPIARLRERLVASGLTEGEVQRVQTAALAEMRGALDSARTAPWPPDESVFDDVQDIGSPAKGAAY
ncbi:MAG: thiamine pyrophosphate-dependent dehydrogenase E1 component subunit alpha [Rhodospirillales bacterium]